MPDFCEKSEIKWNDFCEKSEIKCEVLDFDASIRDYSSVSSGSLGLRIHSDSQIECC
jgi:hypothetical protein